MSEFTIGQKVVVIDPEDTWYGDTVKIVAVRDPQSPLREYEAQCPNGQESFFRESDLATMDDPRSIATKAHVDTFTVKGAVRIAPSIPPAAKFVAGQEVVVVNSALAGYGEFMRVVELPPGVAMKRHGICPTRFVDEVHHDPSQEYVFVEDDLALPDDPRAIEAVVKRNTPTGSMQTDAAYERIRANLERANEPQSIIDDWPHEGWVPVKWTDAETWKRFMKLPDPLLSATNEILALKAEVARLAEIVANMQGGK